MAFDLGVFKDAAAAVDKVVGAVSKLGTMLTTATKTGVLLFDFATARRTLSVLSSFRAQQVTLAASQQLILFPLLKTFIESPTPDNWNLARDQVKLTQDMVNEISDVLKKSERALVTTDFYPILVKTIMAREPMLFALLGQTTAPSSPVEIEAIKLFLKSYDKLVIELDTAGKALAKYIESIKSTGDWPDAVVSNRKKKVPSTKKKKGSKKSKR